MFAQGRSPHLFKHKFSRTDQYYNARRVVEYDLPTTITKEKSDKEKRSLNGARSKNLHTKESIYSQNKEPNYSAFSGLSSFASFNIFGSRNVPKSRFSCRKRAPGYYADMELGCKVRKKFIFRMILNYLHTAIRLKYLRLYSIM